MFPSIHKFAFVIGSLLQSIFSFSSLQAVVVTCLSPFAVVRFMLKGNGVLHKNSKMRCCEFDALVGSSMSKDFHRSWRKTVPPLRHLIGDTSLLFLCSLHHCNSTLFRRLLMVTDNATMAYDNKNIITKELWFVMMVG
ncbi:hypothetical protein CDAR_191221 [Caerostris darwini]|uniref:Secreted protein n=1 Tax=Caerostris darwini TaxID=1538125 RepID=A0AAV4X2C7_9ARAC|nr:hypothetical protein CDAR_191221 [Caerostris darwini]